MSLLIAYVDGDKTNRLHINNYDKTQHKGRVTCAYDHKLVGKKGQKVSWHYAHTAGYDTECSRRMGPWHRWWQDRVIDDFLEIILIKDIEVRDPETGQMIMKPKKHIADMINGDDIVVEFQKSVVPPETLLEREAFYDNLIWVFCCEDHDINITHQEGRFVRIKLIRGSRYFLAATETSFLDFGRRGVVELLKSDTRRKTNTVLHGRMWSQTEFDQEYMQGCLKDDADTRIHREPYKISKSSVKFEEFVRSSNKKNRKN